MPVDHDVIPHWNDVDCQEARRPRAGEGGRCRPGHIAVEVGHMPVLPHAMGEASSVDPTLSTVKQKQVIT